MSVVSPTGIRVQEAVGFTGTTQGMTNRQWQAFRSLIHTLKAELELKTFHHGDCVGADAQAHQVARSNGFWIVGHPPSYESKRAYMPCDEYRQPKPYLARNHDIVDECYVMIATPKETEEIVRSGTWATIRYSRKKGRHLFILTP